MLRLAERGSISSTLQSTINMQALTFIKIQDRVFIHNRLIHSYNFQPVSKTLLEIIT